MFSNVMRDKTRKTAARWGMTFLFGILLSPVAFGAEIGRVMVDGGDLSIEIEAATTFDPTVQLELRLVTAGGDLIDSESFMPILGGTKAISLYGEFRGLDTRGWQHRLELRDNAATLDTLDVRFGLDCVTDPCQIVARRGIRLSGTIGVAAALAPSLKKSSGVDLGSLAAQNPSLRGPIFETSVDLANQTEESTCQCFFTADITGGGLARSVITSTWVPSGQNFPLNYRWTKLAESDDMLRAGHTTHKEITMDFACFELGGSSLSTLVTTGGLLQVLAPNLTPCSRPCAPRVNWKATDFFWSVYLDTHTDVLTKADFNVSWTVDGNQRFQEDRSWQASGTQFEPLSEGLEMSQVGSPLSTLQLPSTARFGGVSTVEVSGVGTYDRPQVEVAAGATLSASGRSSCTGKVTASSEPTELAPGMTPATLPVILGPGDDT